MSTSATIQKNKIILTIVKIMADLKRSGIKHKLIYSHPLSKINKINFSIVCVNDNSNTLVLHYVTPAHLTSVSYVNQDVDGGTHWQNYKGVFCQRRGSRRTQNYNSDSL